jgi:hypothetical protein
VTKDKRWDLDRTTRSGRQELNGRRECRICQTHAGVHGFPVDLARLSGFPAETGSGSFWVGADGLVIGVGFGDCYGLELTGLFVLIV